MPRPEPCLGDRLELRLLGGTAALKTPASLDALVACKTASCFLLEIGASPCLRMTGGLCLSAPPRTHLDLSSRAANNPGSSHNIIAQGLLRGEGALLRRACRTEPVCSIGAKERVRNGVLRGLRRGVRQVVGHKVR